VVEALCEIFFIGSRWDTTIPGIFYSEVQSEFPIKTELEQLGLEVQLAEKQVGTRMVHGDPRVRFSRRDGSRMVQLGRDLLVVNQLHPYPRYDDWRPAVIDMQAKYRKLVMPLAIQRLGVRYINRVTVPDQTVQMEHYFNLYPQVPQELGAAHGDFLMRLQIPPRHAEHQLVATFATAPSSPEEGLGYLLDLYDIAPMDERYSFDELEHRMDEAHANIELAFESSITDALRELFVEIK